MLPLLITLMVLAGIAAIALFYAGMPWLVLRANRWRLRARCRARRAIVLTFDDGPGRSLTPRIVERLDAANVPGTFFVLGRNVDGNEDLVELVRARGHRIGSHGEDHVHCLRSWPGRGVIDITRAWQRLGALLGTDARRLPFRPPYGKLDLVSLLWVRQNRAPIVLWTHDGCDARPDLDLEPRQLADRLRADGGGVVLLHDFDRDDPAAGDDVLARLDAVLALRREGFSFLAVDELLAGGQPPSMNSGSST